MAQNENFTDLTETFLRELVTEVRANTAIDIKCKIDVLKEMTNWVKVKNKVAPDGAEGSKIDEYRNALEAGKQPTKSGGIRGRDSRGSRDYGAPGERIAKLEEGQNDIKTPSGKGFRRNGTPSTNAGGISGNVNDFVHSPSPFPKFSGGDNHVPAISAIAGGLPKTGNFGGL